MAHKKVLESVCDNCGTTETTDVTKKSSKSTYLPRMWVHVHSVNDRGVELFSLDLCSKCAKPMLGALSKRK